MVAERSEGVGEGEGDGVGVALGLRRLFGLGSRRRRQRDDLPRRFRRALTSGSVALMERAMISVPTTISATSKMPMMVSPKRADDVIADVQSVLLLLCHEIVPPNISGPGIHKNVIEC